MKLINEHKQKHVFTKSKCPSCKEETMMRYAESDDMWVCQSCFIWTDLEEIEKTLLGVSEVNP